MFKTLENQLACGPYLLGETMTAADVLWASALGWTTQFGLVAATPLIEGYIKRVRSRPAMVRAAARDEALATAQAAPQP